MVVVVGLAGAADVVVGASHTDANGGRGQEAPSLGIELRRVDLWHEPVPTVRVHTTRPITPRVIALAAEGNRSPRLRIEIGARVVPPVGRAIGGAGVVRGITVEQSSAREAAITVALAKPVGHRVRRDGRLVAIELADDAAPAADVAAPAPAGREPAIALERGGARFVWPDLDAPCYADPAAAVERLALKGWRQGGMTPDAPANHSSAAGRYLAADVTYLRTLMGQMEPLDAVAAYDRALRAAPGFADAPRALVMIGFASLRLGLAPEADTAFGRALDERPGSRYAGVARIGRAAALRERARFDEAAAILAAIAEPPPAALRCDLLLERAGLARATGRHADAVALDEGLAAECGRFDALPTTAHERADSLLALGRRPEARALLTRATDGLDVAAQANLLVRAAELAREDGDPNANRNALERALGLRIGRGTRAGVQARLARLDALVSPARALATLDALAANAPTAAMRGDVVGLMAETLADAGRFEDALARLAVPAEATDDEADAMLVRRGAILARWFDRLAAADDPAGIVALYARHRTTVDTHASSATARRVAGALTRMALPGPALRVLRLRDRGDDPAHRLAVVEAAIVAGEPALADDLLARLEAASLPTPLVVERARLAARLAAASGHPERVRMDPASPPDAALAGELARAWTARGDAAAAGEAWAVATDAYERAQALAPDGAARLLATAGLAAARAAAGTHPIAHAADDLAPIDDRALRRAVAAIAATREFGIQPATAGTQEAARER